MKNSKTKNNILIKLSLLFISVIIFSAFGCKNEEDQAATEETSMDTAASEVTFAPPEPSATTDTTSDSSVTISETTDTTTELDDALTPTTEDPTASDNLVNDSAVEDKDASLDTGTTATNEASQPDVTSGVATDEEEVLKLSKVLAEIYGTFTNKDLEPFKNFKNLKTYASEGMNKWIDSKVAGYQASESTAFYGITTKALSAGTLNSSSTGYKILVTCEREEIIESSQSPDKFYQLVEMNFIKSGEKWLLDSAFWQ